MLQKHQSEVTEDQCSCLVQQGMQKSSIHKDWSKWQQEMCRSINQQIELLCKKLVLNFMYVIQFHRKCTTFKLKQMIHMYF